MWYIFEKEIVQGPQKQCSQVKTKNLENLEHLENLENQENQEKEEKQKNQKNLKNLKKPKKLKKYRKAVRWCASLNHSLNWLIRLSFLDWPWIFYFTNYTSWCTTNSEYAKCHNNSGWYTNPNCLDVNILAAPSHSHHDYDLIFWCKISHENSSWKYLTK